MEEQAKNNQLKPSISGLCFHCGLPSRKTFSAVVNNESRDFCCNGCRSACELIFSVNADSYYKNRIGFSEAPVKQESKIYPYDSEVFRNQYLEDKNGFKTIFVHLDNLHCPSCIWVIEKVIGNILGIIDLSVNFTTHKAKISWDESKVSLEYILNTLVKIGYSPSPIDKNNLNQEITNRNKNLLLRMVISGFATLSTMFLAEPFYFTKIGNSAASYFSYVEDLDLKSAIILQYLSLFVSTPIFFYTITPFFKGMKTALRYGIFTMDSSIFIGASLIYFYSLFATLANHSPVYFDCLTMFLFLILMGRFIESSVQQKVFNQAEQNIRLYPKQALVIRDQEENLIHIDEVKINDLIFVRPGEQIPVDGIVVDGESHVNESVITGESKSVKKKFDDSVLGGSLNLEGAFYFRATKICSDSTLRQISTLVENIQAKRTPRKTFTDKVAHIFISAVLLLAITVYIYYFKQDHNFALLTAISVLVVSCPCALGLAMPATISITGFSAIKKGILFKSSDALEKMDKVNHIVFDKTGTLTSGKMELTEIKSFSDYSEENLLEIASSIERYSEHPIAWSIVTEANKRKVKLRKAQGFISFPGKGIKGKLDGKEYMIGSLLFLKENNQVVSGITLNENEICQSQIFIADNHHILGYFLLKDKLRDNVVETINNLKSRNIKMSLLSGDRKEIAEKTAEYLGIKNVISEVLPEQKSEYIKSLKNQGFQVAMIGDGVNDAPAMAEADVSIAIFSNNDLTNMNANVVVLNSDFSSLINVIEITKKSNMIIKQNLLISVIYNMIVLPFAVSGSISPLLATILMPLSSLVVLLNSVRAGK